MTRLTAEQHHTFIAEGRTSIALTVDAGSMASVAIRRPNSTGTQQKYYETSTVAGIYPADVVTITAESGSIEYAVTNLSATYSIDPTTGAVVGLVGPSGEEIPLGGEGGGGPSEWTAETVTQEEAEAGTATTRRAWTAQRVFQAIAAWWAGSSDKTKLDGIAIGATANSSDATLLDRANHTGTQAISTISGLQTALDATASLSGLSAHTSNTSNPHGVTKSQVGLGNVDNTSDATKNAATATLTNKTLTAPVLSNPSFSGTTANMGTVTTIDINGGTADGMTMGASAALARVNTDRLETTRTAVTAPASTDGNIFSGTYTPSLTPVANIGTSAAVACQYMRVGNVVSVSGHVYLGPAATGPTLIGVTLPVPSNFTIPSQLGGTFAASGVDENPGSIYADTANDLAVFDLQAKQTAVAAYTFHFTYVVL